MCEPCTNAWCAHVRTRAYEATQKNGAQARARATVPRSIRAIRTQKYLVGLYVDIMHAR